MKLHTKIFIGLVAGIALGALSKSPTMVVLNGVLVALEPFGTAFIRLITMVVVPLVIASVFVGVASLGDVRRLGRLGGRTLAYFLGTTLLAATLGLGVATLAHHGDQGLTALASIAVAPSAVPASVPTLGSTLMAMVPQNPFASAAQGDLLPLIVAVCIFGAAATVVPDEKRRAVVSFFQSVNDLCMVVIAWLMLLAPIAVAVLIASTVARSGLALLAQLSVYAVHVVLALVLYVAIVMLPAIKFGARLGVVAFFRAVSDALVLAFSTASSSATLPVSMAAARTRLGVPSEIVGFVLPAGTTLNKNGAAVYKAATAVFLAHVYGLSIGPAEQLTIVLTSTLAAFAGAGVPGSSLVTTMIVLNAIGLGPNAAAGIALVVAVDRPLDMCRTTVNTIGNLVVAAWIARTEAAAAPAT